MVSRPKDRHSGLYSYMAVQSVSDQVLLSSPERLAAAAAEPYVLPYFTDSDLRL